MTRSPGTAAFTLFLSSLLVVCCYGKVAHKVRCSSSTMVVDIYKNEDVKDVYLDHLKGYPKCQPKKSSDRVLFNLPLDDSFYLCGTTRVLNKLTGRLMYYHRVVVEYNDAAMPKEVLMVKCDVHNNRNLTQILKGNRTRRDILPPGFEEPEYIEITSELVKEAPTPDLSMVVLQFGRPVGTELTVQPGTPLTMEVRLDPTSASVYGILSKYMQVSDTKNQEEPIIVNGCSVDNYLFENFGTTNGDVLRASFRAFKFPQSVYVMFYSTVNVCLDKCLPSECSNGEFGYGRKRRAIPNNGVDPNILFEISTSTSIKVQYEKEIPLQKGSLSGYHNEAPEIGAAIVEPIHGQRSLQYTVYESGSSSVVSKAAIVLSLLVALLRL